MNITLIGATGQIGYALAQKLAQSEHHLTVLVRDKKKVPFPENVRVIARKPFDEAAFATVLADADHVIYGVGLPEQFLQDDTTFQRINYDLLARFLKLLAETAVPRLTYISTYEVFTAVDGMIRESHPEAVLGEQTLYFQTMIQAYQLVRRFAGESSVQVSTIHPAAVYGGLNTSQGFTNFIENLRHKRIAQVPFVFEGRFPLIHADSLAEGIILSLSNPGAYLLSDEMASLPQVARLLHELTDSFVPPIGPAWLAQAGAVPLELVARVTGKPPTMSRVQIHFILQGWEPCTEHAQATLGWQPLPLREGLRRYLEVADTMPEIVG